MYFIQFNTIKSDIFKYKIKSCVKFKFSYNSDKRIKRIHVTKNSFGLFVFDDKISSEIRDPRSWEYGTFLNFSGNKWRIEPSISEELYQEFYITHHFWGTFLIGVNLLFFHWNKFIAYSNCFIRWKPPF